MPVITPITPLEEGGEMFQRAKTASLFHSRPISEVSETTEIFDTDFEDDSEYEPISPKGSLESQDSRRRSQTTISSYDEAPTPSPRTSTQRGHFELRFRPVEGPKGPHLFRSSQASADFDFDYAMQMSPLLPKETPLRVRTAFSDNTPTPTVRQHRSMSFETVRREPEPELHDPEAHIRSWTTEQVIDWMLDTGIDTSVVECFDIHDINGAVLLDLQFEDLKELDIQSFGKRHQLWNAICLLRGEDGHSSPTQTPFQDISRPCTSTLRPSPSRSQSVPPESFRPISPNGGKKRRGRKASKTADIITPAESVSIVAIEQLLPKPHKCNKGERCAKWRKQQRELKQLQDEHGIGRFPISPTKGGRIFIAGDPGNAPTADNMIPNVHKQPLLQMEDPFRPISEAQPSVVASSDLLGPGQLPEFALREDMLNHLGSRDPQDNVKHFLHFQHMQSPTSEDAPPSPPLEMFPTKSVFPFPAQYNPHQSPARPQTAAPRGNIRTLPRLDIPRAASAGPQLNTLRSPETATSICRSAAASPATTMIYRLGTPASEMDVPLSSIPSNGPVSRDTSQSVPPNMQFRNQSPLSRTASRAGAPDWRRPSMALPAVMEGEVFSPTRSPSKAQRPSLSGTSSSDSDSTGIARKSSIRDPAHHTPTTKQFGYGEDCTQAGWMKKRKTKMLRHEWQEAHFRLKGTQLSQHANARLSALAIDTIDVEKYSVACSTVQSNNKLTAAMKALSIKTSTDEKKKKDDPTAFAFQLIPGDKKSSASGKTHHFAVKNKDERIDWMREVMLAKAKEQKKNGYDVEVNGVQA